MAKTIEEIRAELDAKIPRDVVSSRSAGGGRSLSYLEGHYVIDRLNKIFGPEGWSKKIISLEKLYEGEVNGKTYVSYRAQLSLSVAFPNGTVRSIDDVGFGDGQDGNNPGKPHELAIKEAVTDALKRCAKDLGMSMGLALYSKDQENVTDEKESNTTTKANSGDSVTNGAAYTNRAPAKVDTPSPIRTGSAVGSEPLKQKAETLRKVIISAAQALETRGTISKTEFKTKYITDKFKVAQLSELSDTQIKELYNTIKETYKELQLQ